MKSRLPLTELPVQNGAGDGAAGPPASGRRRSNVRNYWFWTVAWAAVAVALGALLVAFGADVQTRLWTWGITRAADGFYFKFYGLVFPARVYKPSIILWAAWYYCIAGCLAAAAVPWVGRLKPAFFRPRRLRKRWLALAFAAAFVLLGLTSYFGFGRGPYNVDEAAFLFQARIFAAGSLWAEKPPMDIPGYTKGALHKNFFVAFPGWGVVKDNRWFTIYGPVHPALLAAGYVVKAPWLVNPLCAAFVPPLLMALAAAVFGADRAPWAALFAFASTFWLTNGATFASEGSWLPLFLAFLFFGWRAYDKGSRPSAFTAGLFFGLAAADREWATIVSAAAFLVYFGWRSLRNRRERSLGWAFAAGVLPVLVLYYAYNVALTRAFFDLTREYSVWDHLGLGGDFTLTRAFTSLFLNFYAGATAFLGWPLLSLAPLAAYPLVTKPTSTFARLCFATVGTLVVGNFFVRHEGIMYGPRYYAALFPIAVLLAADLAARWDRRLNAADASGTNFVSKGWARSAVLALSLVAVVYWSPMAVGWRRRSEAAYVTCVRWGSDRLKAALKEGGVHNAVVFVAPARMFRGPMPNWPDFRDDVVYARDHGPRDAAVIRFLPGRVYIRCDYREFDKTGLLWRYDRASGEWIPFDAR